MGFLSDVATLLKAGLTIDDVKELVKMNGSAEKVPDQQMEVVDLKEPETKDDAKDGSDMKYDAVMKAISKLTSTIQASNIINSTGKQEPELSVDDILANNIRSWDGGGKDDK